MSELFVYISALNFEAKIFCNTIINLANLRRVSVYLDHYQRNVFSLNDEILKLNWKIYKIIIEI